MNFQVKYNHGKGLASYVYFEAEEGDAKAKACQKANEYLAKARQGTYPGAIYNPPKTAYVVEYSQLWNRPVRGGIKFKLVYCYAKFTNSQKQVTAFKEWYEIMD